MSRMNEYERAQLARLRAWQAQPPGFALRGFGKALGPAARAAEALVPVVALRGALNAASAAADRLSSRRTILKRAGVAGLSDLRGGELERCDRLARIERRRGTAMAGASGAAFGVAGAVGMVADVPTLLVLTLRTIHRVGLCYGEDSLNGSARPLTVGVFALASANSLDEKRAVLAALRGMGEEARFASTPRGASERLAMDGRAGVDRWQNCLAMDGDSARVGVERIAERELAKEAAVLSLNNLARQLGQHLGLRKAAGALPVVGAAVGGSVNAWYLRDVGRAAQCAFQERWLREKYPRDPAWEEPTRPALPRSRR